MAANSALQVLPVPFTSQTVRQRQPFPVFLAADSPTLCILTKISATIPCRQLNEPAQSESELGTLSALAGPACSDTVVHIAQWIMRS